MANAHTYIFDLYVTNYVQNFYVLQTGIFCYVLGAILFQKPELMDMFNEGRAMIDKYLKISDGYVWASMTKGQVTLPIFQSLEAYWPGVLSLIGIFIFILNKKCI